MILLCVDYTIILQHFLEKSFLGVSKTTRVGDQRVNHLIKMIPNLIRIDDSYLFLKD